MKHLLLTTIAVTSLLATTAFAGPIHDATDRGDLAAVQAELDRGVSVNAKNDFGETPLHRAAIGHKEIAELLIDKGADVNAKSRGAVNLKVDWRLTPLHYAADRGHKEVAELLIDKGADVNAKDDFGFTPLDRAEKVEFWHHSVEAPREGDGRVYLPGDLNAAKEETAILIREHGGITYREDVEYKFNSLKEQLSQLQHLIIGDDAGVDPDKPSIEKLQGVFVIRGKVGGKYEVQYHTGDNDWLVREEITLTANRQLYIDSSSFDEKRFYRVKLVE